MKERPKSILVSMLVNLGDVIMQTAQLESLKKYVLPHGGRLGVLVRPEAAEIVLGHPLIDEVIIYPYRSGSLWQGIKAVTAQVKKNTYDCYLSLDRRPRGALVALLSGIKKRIGPVRLFPDRPIKLWTYLLYNKRVPMSMFDCQGSYMQMFHKVVSRAFNLDIPLGSITLPPPPEGSLAKVNELLQKSSGRPVVGLCLKTKEPAKTWPLPYYLQLIKNLRAEGVFIYITGAPEDRDYAAGAIKALGLTEADGLLNLAGLTSLSDLMALAPKTDLFIGPDNGVAHLLAHAGLKKMIVIMLSTTPESVEDSLAMAEIISLAAGPEMDSSAALVFRFAQKALAF